MFIGVGVKQQPKESNRLMHLRHTYHGESHVDLLKCHSIV